MPDRFKPVVRFFRRPCQALNLFLCLLVACQPSVTPSAQPTPHILVAQVTPALQSLSAQFHTCADELPSAGLVIVNTPAESLDTNQAAVALRWGMQSQPAGYAAVLGQEALAVIVSKDNPHNTIAFNDLISMYQGKLRAWPGTGSEAAVWTYPAGDDASSVFESVLLGGSAISRGVVYTAPDPQAMLEAVSKDPNAVGYLPRRWLNDSVKMLSIDGVDPESLHQPIVALSKSEPEGPEKSWLLCLQERLKE